MTNQELTRRLVKHYQTLRFKTQLAKDMEVDVSTIRRIFNSKNPIPEKYQLAIRSLIKGKGHGV